MKKLGNPAIYANSSNRGHAVAGWRTRLTRKPVAARFFGIIWAAGLSTPCFAQSGPLVPPQVMRVSPTGINLDDARYTYNTTDLTIGPMSLERSYISGPEMKASQFFGPNWTHNYDIYFYSNCGSKNPCISIVIGRTTYQFDRYGSAGSYQYYPEGTAIGTQLAQSGSTWSFTDRHGVKYQFLSSVPAYTGGGQRIGTIAYPNGKVLTFNYVSGKLKTVTSTEGYAIVFDYAASGFVSAACGFNTSNVYVSTATTCSGASPKTQYSYAVSSGANRLSGFYTVFGNFAAVGAGVVPGYTPTGCLISAPSGTCKMAFSGPQGLDQTLGDGTVWHIAPEGDIDFINGPTSYNNLIMIDPNGKWTKYIPQNDASLGATYYDIYDPLNRHIHVDTSGGFDSLITLPEANKVIPGYSSRGELLGNTFVPKPGSGLSSIAQGLGTYPSTCANTVTCNEPLTVTDPKGNVTDFTYDQTHGGVLSEMGPAPSAGAARPLKLYTYVLKYAYIKNSAGSLVSSGVPIWVVNTITQCQTAAGSSTTTCDTSAPRLQTTYEYGADGTANNLLARGLVATDLATGASRRACYGYDAIGRKISDTSSNAGLAVCS